MTDHDIDPAFLAHVDQERARTREEIDRLAAKFRDHADTVHNGDPVCAHALTAVTLYLFRNKLTIADLMGGAIARIVELEREVEQLTGRNEELGRTIHRYQTYRDA